MERGNGMSNKHYGFVWKQNGQYMGLVLPTGTPLPPLVYGENALACDTNSSYIRRLDGSVVSCGYNNFGQLCRDVEAGSPSTVNLGAIPDLAGVVQMACGNGAVAFLLENGIVMNAGRNAYGQLCRSTSEGTAEATNFGQIPDLTDVKKIAMGNFHMAVLKRDGTIGTAGYNMYGQLCRNVESGTTTATNFGLVTGLNDVVDIACGEYSTYLIRSDGSVWSAGENAYGQLCRNIATGTSTATNFGQIPDLTGVKKIAAGGKGVCFLLDGIIKNAGNNDYGQLGRNVDNVDYFSGETNFGTITDLDDVEDVVFSGDTLFIMMSDGTIKSAGYNVPGNLCRNAQSGGALLTNIADIPGLSGVVGIAASKTSTFIGLSDGTVMNAGANGYGQLGRLVGLAANYETNIGVLEL